VDTNVVGSTAPPPPNFTVAPGTNPEPSIVTVLPPAVEPAFGDRLVTAAAATFVEVIPDPQPLFDAPLLASPP
jgi:hypothetical protein